MNKMTPLSLSCALSRVSEELGSLHVVSVELQDIICDLGSGVPQKAQVALARIQKLDRLTQELEDLGPLISRFAALASKSESENVSEALTGIKLVSLKDRLANAETQVGAYEAGDAELF